MSLLIIGSCSKITSNIILSLSKQNLYQNITIADVLPLYSHHERYYKLRKHLNEQRSSTSVSLDKIISPESLNNQVKNHKDVLHITHDYFTSATSKQKIMELTAHMTKNVIFSLNRNKMLSMLHQFSTTITDKVALSNFSWIQSKKSWKSIRMPILSGEMFKIQANFTLICTKAKIFGRKKCYRLLLTSSLG